MQFIIPIVLIAVLVIANVTTRDMKPKTSRSSSTPLNSTSTTTPSPTLSTTPTPSKDTRTQVTITIIQPSPTVKVQTQPPTTSGWIYPQATVTSQANGSISLTSLDNPTTITNWYKDKIKTMGMNTTSFVMTNTNDNVLNKLAATNGSLNVQVEIKKDSGSSTTSISVSF